jgi:hypothetical protein
MLMQFFHTCVLNRTNCILLISAVRCWQRLGHLPQGGRAFGGGDDSDSEADDYSAGFSDADSQWDGGEVEVSPEDEAALAAFMAPGAAAFRQATLADIILDKIRQKQEAQGLPQCVAPFPSGPGALRRPTPLSSSKTWGDG